MRKASTKTHLFWKVPSTRTAVLCGLTLLIFSGCGDEPSASIAESPDVSEDATVDEDSVSTESEDVAEESGGAGAEEDATEKPNDAAAPVDEADSEVPETEVAECLGSGDCDDGNPCSKGLCIVGKCEWIPISDFCSDGSVCTTNDQCIGETCVGEEVLCDDLDPCTVDSCDPVTGCTHNVLDEACYEEEEECEGENCDDPCLNGDTEACEALQDIAQVSAGGQFTCGRTGAGDVWCWGSNAQGQLGNGSTLNYSVPSEVLGVANATQIASGFGHSCAVVEEGKVRCWGGNSWGQLGDGSNSGSLATYVVGLTSIVQVVAGTAHSCALSESGRVYCWGQGTFGQLGNGEAKTYATPVEVIALSGVSQITAGGHHTCARTDEGELFCWGYNGIGQLGNVSTESFEVEPQLVFDQDQTGFVDAYGDTTCSVSTSGEVYCWGSNGSAKLGIVAEDVPGSIVPVAIPSLAPVVELSVGEEHVCVILEEGGDVSCWGINDHIVALEPKDAAVPSHIAGTGSTVQVASGQQHVCVLSKENEVQCWGTNVNGQLGNGGKTSSSDPTPVVGLP